MVLRCDPFAAELVFELLVVAHVVGHGHRHGHVAAIIVALAVVEDEPPTLVRFRQSDRPGGSWVRRSAERNDSAASTGFSASSAARPATETTSAIAP